MSTFRTSRARTERSRATLWCSSDKKRGVNPLFFIALNLLLGNLTFFVNFSPFLLKIFDILGSFFDFLNKKFDFRWCLWQPFLIPIDQIVRRHGVGKYTTWAISKPFVYVVVYVLPQRFFRTLLPSYDHYHEYVYVYVYVFVVVVVTG